MSKVTILTKPNRIVIASKGVQGRPGADGDITPEAIAARDAAQGAASAAAASAAAADGAAEARVQALRSDLADPSSGASLVAIRRDYPEARTWDVRGKAMERVTVQDFMTPAQRIDAAQGSPVMDHTSAIQNFFDYIANRPVQHAEISGRFNVSAPLTLTGSSASNALHCNAVINALGSNNGALLSILNATQLTLVGSLELLGNGGPDYATRNWRRGLHIRNSARTCFEGRVTVRNFREWGVRVHSSISDGSGNTTLSSLGNIRALNCGPRRGDLPAAISARSNSGTSGSSGQRTILTLSHVPSDADLNDLILVGGQPHIVTAISGDQVTVFPWVDAAASVGSQVSWLNGGGVYITGADANLIDARMVDVSGCSIGFRPVAFFQGQAARVVAQDCTIGVVTGNGVSSGSYNLHLENPYFEINELNWVNTSYAEDGVLVTADLGLNDPWSKVVQLGPRSASGEFTPSLTTLPQATVITRGEVLTRNRNARPDGTSAGTNIIGLGYSPGSFHSLRSNSPTIVLADHPDKRRLFAYVDLHVFVSGTGPNGRPSGTVTVNAEPGYTVNGAGNLVLSGLRAAVLLHARLVGTNWEVSHYIGSVAPTRSYVVSNATPDRTFDANATSTEELANVLGTLISDLRERGVVL